MGKGHSQQAEVICDGITLVIFALSFVAKKESNDE